MRVLEQIMNRQNPAAPQVRRPAAIISQRCFETVAAVDKNHGQGSLPVTGGGLRAGNDRNDRVVESGTGNIAAEFLEGIPLPLAGVVEVRVVEVFALVVFFRAPMVVQGENGGGVLAAGQAQVDGGLATVTANLQHRSPGAFGQRMLVQGLGLVVGEKALDVIYIGGKICNHRGKTVVRGLGKVAVLAA